jgi:hypothetical protein
MLFDLKWICFTIYLKIGLHYLQGVLKKGRQLLAPIPLCRKDPEPCFPSKKAKKNMTMRLNFP